MTDLRVLALDDGFPEPVGAEPTQDATPDPIEPQRPATGLVEASSGDGSEPSPYYLREWRGAALFGCPECDFTSRGHDGVVRHAGIVHTPVRAPSLAERAARAGIVIAR